MATPLQNATLFLLHTFFNLYISVVLLRFLFQFFRADFRNPLSQLVVKLTAPVLNPLRRVIPGLWGVDFAAVLLLLVLQGIELLAEGWVVSGPFLFSSLEGWLGWGIWSLGELLKQLFGLYTFVILIMIFASWIPNFMGNPMLIPLQQISDPLMRPARRMLPPVSGFDFSPILVFIFLQLMGYLVADPIVTLGRHFIG